MTRTTPLQPARLGAAVLITLLAFSLDAPSARAGCSHYVVSGSRAAGVDAPAGLDLLAVGGPSADPDPDSSAPRPRPCTGPSCSKAPLVPPTPVPSPARAGHEQWGCLGGPQRPDALSPFGLATAREAVRPIHSSSPLDRPPRAG